jgi:hypothetical protein
MFLFLRSRAGSTLAKRGKVTPTLILLFLSLARPAPSPGAPIQWSGSGHFYELTSVPETWLQAEAEAVGKGGHLVSLTSQAENDFVVNTFTQPGSLNINGTVWMGLTDAGQIGTWTWTTGEPFSFSNWYPGEPNNLTTEFYTQLYNADFGGQWNNINDGGSLYGVIEFSGTPSDAPEPGTGLTLIIAGSLVASGSVRSRRVRSRVGKSFRTRPTTSGATLIGA